MIFVTLFDLMAQRSRMLWKLDFVYNLLLLLYFTIIDFLLLLYSRKYLFLSVIVIFYFAQIFQAAVLPEYFGVLENVLFFYKSVSNKSLISQFSRNL